MKCLEANLKCKITSSSKLQECKLVQQRALITIQLRLVSINGTQIDVNQVELLIS